MRKLSIILLLILGWALPVSAQEAQLSEVTIKAQVRSYVLSQPAAAAAFIRSYERGVEEIAFGRDASGTWLRILDGWVLAEVFAGTADVALLPDTTASISGSVSDTAILYDGPSAKWFEPVGEIEAGAKAIAIGRNEDGAWLQLPWGWLEAAQFTGAGDHAALPVGDSGVIITAAKRTFILSEPDLGADFVDVFEAGEEALAIGRNGNGDWIEISQGWVPAEAVELNGNVNELPYSAVGAPKGWVPAEAVELNGNVNELSYSAVSVPIRLKQPVSNVSPKLGISGSSVRRLERGDEEHAIARNSNGSWLHIGDGWVFARYFEIDGDINDLPIVTKTGEIDIVQIPIVSQETQKTTPPPSSPTGLDAGTIRRLVSRHTDDVRLLNIEISNSATSIEYDLKPWAFVPNESIAEEVAFKVICAIRNGQKNPEYATLART